MLKYDEIVFNKLKEKIERKEIEARKTDKKETKITRKIITDDSVLLGMDLAIAVNDIRDNYIKDIGYCIAPSGPAGTKSNFILIKRYIENKKCISYVNFMSNKTDFMLTQVLLNKKRIFKNCSVIRIVGCHDANDNLLFEYVFIKCDNVIEE